MRGQGASPSPAVSQPEKHTDPWTASTTRRSEVAAGSTARRMPPCEPHRLSTMPARTRSCWIERANEYGTSFRCAADLTDMTPLSERISSATMRKA